MAMHGSSHLPPREENHCETQPQRVQETAANDSSLDV
jgi:hypothetical protein